MQTKRGRTAHPCNWSYTRGVTARTLFSGMVGLSALLATTLIGASATARPNTHHRTERAQHEADQTAQSNASQSDDDALPDTAAQGETDPLAHARQGVVTLERRGKVLGLGTVLAGDGRILTALSPLTHGNNIDAVYADGSVARVKVGHADRGWDLALLVPQNGRWTKGLKASSVDAEQAGTGLRSFAVVGGKNLALSRTIVKGESTLLGADSELLPNALALATHFQRDDLGAPIIDKHGNVVAVVARACAPIPNAPCARVPYGVPVSAIKAFLRTVPRNAVPPAPWLGIQGVAAHDGPVRGVRVLSVHPGSPAAAAGLKGSGDPSTSDVVVAVDQRPVESPEQLARAINAHGVGDSVDLLVYGGGKFRRVSLTLSAAPDGARAPGARRPRAQRLIAPP
jgi:serine protease Do